MAFASPVIAKEVRVLLRSRKAFWFLMLLLLVSGGFFWLFWFGQGSSISSMGRSNFARMMFLLTSMVQLCALGLIAPIMTATSVTIERENKTLDLLYCTGLSRLHILLGKWFSTIAYELILAICLMPIMSLIFMLGGVSLEEYLFVAVMIALTIMTYGMLGLAISTRMRKTATAMFTTLFTVLALALLIPLGCIFSSELFRWGIFRNNPINWGFLEAIPFGLSPVFTFGLYLGTLMGSGATQNPWASLNKPFLIDHFIIQALIFFGSARVAWRGMARGESFKPQLAKKIIDDPEILRRRSQRFPYYLIDPLRRTQEIHDHQNPVYIKEQRVGALGKLTFLIRVGYIGVIFSIMLIPISINDTSIGSMSYVAQWVIGFTLIFLPILASPVLSKEREEKTLDLLRCAPLTPRQIIAAKYAYCLRFVLLLILCMMVIPAATFIISLTSGFMSGTTLGACLVVIAKVMVYLAAFALFFTALGLYFSGLCRRTVTAVVSTYAAILACVFSPVVLYVLHMTMQSRSSGRHNESIFSICRDLVCPFLSPYIRFEFWVPTRRRMDWFFTYDTQWWPILIRALVVLGLAAFFFSRTVHRFKKAGLKDP